MEYTIEYDRMPAYVLIKTEGNPSEQAFDRLLSELVAAPGWVPGINQLIDHRNLQFDRLTYNLMEKIHHVVQKHKKKLGNGKIALVVRNACGFGLSRMYELIGGESIHEDINVFYSIDEAEQWIEK